MYRFSLLRLNEIVKCAHLWIQVSQNDGSTDVDAFASTCTDLTPFERVQLPSFLQTEADRLQRLPPFFGLRVAQYDDGDLVLFPTGTIHAVLSAVSLDPNDLPQSIPPVVRLKIYLGAFGAYDSAPNDCGFAYVKESRNANKEKAHEFEARRFKSMGLQTEREEIMHRLNQLQPPIHLDKSGSVVVQSVDQHSVAYSAVSDINHHAHATVGADSAGSSTETKVAAVTAFPVLHFSSADVERVHNVMRETNVCIVKKAVPAELHTMIECTRYLEKLVGLPPDFTLLDPLHAVALHSPDHVYTVKKRFPIPDASDLSSAVDEESLSSAVNAVTGLPSGSSKKRRRKAQREAEIQAAARDRRHLDLTHLRRDVKDPFSTHFQASHGNTGYGAFCPAALRACYSVLAFVQAVHQRWFEEEQRPMHGGPVPPPRLFTVQMALQAPIPKVK